jgi:hypothetical protein
MKIAYLILAHRDIEMVYTQIEVLSTSNCAFYIHFDKELSIDRTNEHFQRTNVFLAKERFQINWGGFSIVQATLHLLEEAFSSPVQYDYFVLLSGQCLSIKENREIENFLEQNICSVIEMNPLPDNQLKDGGLDKIKYWYPFDFLSLININYKKLLFRYLSSFCKSLRISRRLDNKTTYCFGSQWWGLNRESVEYVLFYCKENPKVVRFYRYTWAPDELFFQTILYNSPLRDKISNRIFRYLEWSKQGPPKVLDESSYDFIMNSGYLFARKFDSQISSGLIEKLHLLSKIGV